MNIKKVITLLCAVIISSCMTSCESKTKKINSNETTNILTDSMEIKETATEIESKESQNSETESNDLLTYSETVFTIDTDIPQGTYLITCTSDNGCMDVILFSNEEDYNNFNSADKITGGEFISAVAENAWSDFYLYPNESIFIRLDSGNKIYLDDGMCEFNKYSITDSNILYPGVYEIGKDIDIGKIDFKFVSDYPKITLFKTKDNYLDYHKTFRLTGGEEEEAINNNSLSSSYIYSDEVCSLNLEDGMILYIQDGIVEFGTSTGPIIN